MSTCSCAQSLLSPKHRWHRAFTKRFIHWIQRGPRVRMHTTFENGVLPNGQQPGSAVNSFIDLGEFGAMKTLSGRIAPRCDKHQFCNKMTVST